MFTDIGMEAFARRADRFSEEVREGSVRRSRLDEFIAGSQEAAMRWFRVYAEMQDANVSNEKLPPSPTDRDKTDILNLFVDVKAFELWDNAAYIRGGRSDRCGIDIGIEERLHIHVHSRSARRKRHN